MEWWILNFWRTSLQSSHLIIVLCCWDRSVRFDQGDRRLQCVSLEKKKTDKSVGFTHEHPAEVLFMNISTLILRSPSRTEWRFKVIQRWLSFQVTFKLRRTDEIARTFTFPSSPRKTLRIDGLTCETLNSKTISGRLTSGKGYPARA